MAEERKRTSSDTFQTLGGAGGFVTNTRNGNKKMSALSLQPTGPSSGGSAGGGFGGLNLFQAANATKQSKEAPEGKAKRERGDSNGDLFMQIERVDPRPAQ